MELAPERKEQAVAPVTSRTPLQLAATVGWVMGRGLIALVVVVASFLVFLQGIGAFAGGRYLVAGVAWTVTAAGVFAVVALSDRKLRGRSALHVAGGAVLSIWGVWALVVPAFWDSSVHRPRQSAMRGALRNINVEQLAFADSTGRFARDLEELGWHPAWIDGMSFQFNHGTDGTLVVDVKMPDIWYECGISISPQVPNPDPECVRVREE